MGADLRVTGVSAVPPSVFSTIALRLLRVEYRSPAANRGLCSCRPELLTLKLFAHTLKPATLMLADSVTVRVWQFRWQFDHCVLSAIHKPRARNVLCHRQTAFLSLILLQPPRFGSRLTTLAWNARPGGRQANPVAWKVPAIRRTGRGDIYYMTAATIASRFAALASHPFHALVGMIL